MALAACQRDFLWVRWQLWSRIIPVVLVVVVVVGITIKFPAILSHFGLLPLRAVGICLVQAKPNLLSKFSLPACQWQLCWLEPKPTMSGS